MNNKILMITTTMIFITIVVLLCIFFSYLTSRDIANSRPSSNLHVSGETSISGDKKVKDEIKPEDADSGDLPVIDEPLQEVDSNKSIDEPSITNNENPQENVEVENNQAEIKDENKSDTIEQKDNKPVNIEKPIKEDPKIQEPIISSSTDTSNEEKRQVLNELDTALQGLLEAVGNVPTVDEDKLNASLTESEVAP